jgi:hypothetical protein
VKNGERGSYGASPTDTNGAVERDPGGNSEQANSASTSGRSTGKGQLAQSRNSPHPTEEEKAPFLPGDLKEAKNGNSRYLGSDS